MISVMIFSAFVILFTLWYAYFLFSRSSDSTPSSLKPRYNRPEDELDKAEKGAQSEQSTTRCDICANQNIETFSAAWFDALYFLSDNVCDRRSAATLLVGRFLLLCFNAYLTWFFLDQRQGYTEQTLRSTCEHCTRARCDKHRRLVRIYDDYDQSVLVVSSASTRVAVLQNMIGLYCRVVVK